LAEVMLANGSFGVNQIQRWPVLIVERTPDRVVAVHDHGVIDLHLPYCAADIVRVVFERELWRVHADEDERLPILLPPSAKVRQRTQPIDARVGPEVDDDDLPGKAWRGQSGRVEPLDGVTNRRQLARYALVRFRHAERAKPCRGD